MGICTRPVEIVENAASTMRTHRVTANLTDSELARLEEMRPPGCSTSAYLARLVREASPPSPATHAEALQLLAESARMGRVQAVIALERALRPTAGERDLDGELRRILADED